MIIARETLAERPRKRLEMPSWNTGEPGQQNIRGDAQSAQTNIGRYPVDAVENIPIVSPQVRREFTVVLHSDVLSGGGRNASAPDPAQPTAG